MEDILEDYNKFEVKPIQITIDISGECNAKCPFCARQVVDMDLKGFLPKEAFYSIIEQVQELKTIETISLAALGEPLLHPNFDEFVKHLSKLNYNILVTTNMALSHKHFDSLLKATHVIFSIEGHDKKRYEELRKNLSFKKVFENLNKFDKLLKEKRKKREKTPKRLINFITTKNSKVNEFIDLWGDYTDFIRIWAIGHPQQWSKELELFEPVVIKELEQEIIPRVERFESNQCCQPFNLIAIHPNGKLGLCCNDSGCSYDFGDYKNIAKSFFENEKLNLIRDEFKNNKSHTCKNCAYNYNLSIKNISRYLPELKTITNKKIIDSKLD